MTDSEPFEISNLVYQSFRDPDMISVAVRIASRNGPNNKEV